MKSLLVLTILVLGILFVPFWVQIVLYLISIFLINPKFLLILPAMFSDAWYAPSRDLSISNNKTLLIVFGILIVYYFLLFNTRLIQNYGLEKK